MGQWEGQERDWTWARVGEQGGRGIRPSCSGRGLGGAQSSRILSFSLGGGVVWESGLGFAHHPASYFFQPTPTSPHGPLGGPQAQLPYLGAFSPARSQHAPSGSQAPSLPPGVLCGPHVSPSTSALSLVLSHGDWRKESQRVLTGLYRMPTKVLWGEGRERLISSALPPPP